MLVPSIDILNGSTVQLVGGKEKKLDLGSPLPFAQQFGLIGEVAVVDLDAAMGQGSNQTLIEPLLKLARCRVGGGIRNLESAIYWLDKGATKIVLGTAAKPELLSKLPAKRVVAALDALNGEVVVEGWKKGTGLSIFQQIEALRPFVSEFLITFVESEGRLQGIDLERAAQLVKAAGDKKITFAGGINSTEQIAALDSLGADAQVGMALYTGLIDIAEGFAAPLKKAIPSGLWPSIIVDEQGLALGLAWSNLDSLRMAIGQRRGIYQSRQRGLWIKGESSGATQELLRVDLDCDRDCLRFTVKQNGSGFCHKQTRGCFGEDTGLAALWRNIMQRKNSCAIEQTASAPSYTRRLLRDASLLNAKLREEADELCRANNAGEVTAEAADLFYFALVAMARADVSLAEVEAELTRRALKISRRPGNAKAAFITEGS